MTLPNIRWGLMYGVILTNARAMGEFGAVSVISGNIIGKTQTLTLFVESAYKVRALCLGLVHSCMASHHPRVQPGAGVKANDSLQCLQRVQEYDTEAAFSAAVLLAFMALSTLVVKEQLEQSVEKEGEVR